VSVGDLRRIDRLLGLERRIDAFRRNDRLALIVEDERRILPIEHHDVDLLAKHAHAVDDVRRRRLIALRQVGLQQFEPDLFARVALGARMVERLADGFEPPLDIVMQTGEELRQRPGHAVFSWKGGVGFIASAISSARAGSRGREG
jgi:hypothetical protein